MWPFLFHVIISFFICIWIKKGEPHVTRSGVILIVPVGRGVILKLWRVMRPSSLTNSGSPLISLSCVEYTAGVSWVEFEYSTQSQLKDRGITLKLNTKNLSTTGFLFLGEVSFFGSGEVVSDITLDGATDGQCRLRLIETLCDKVDTCMMYQLQRAVLWSLGKTVRTCENAEAQDMLCKNARIVMLSS